MIPDTGRLTLEECAELDELERELLDEDEWLSIPVIPDTGRLTLKECTEIGELEEELLDEDEWLPSTANSELCFLAVKLCLLLTSLGNGSWGLFFGFM